MLYKAAQRYVQRQIGYKDVALVMVVVIAIQVAILLCWQIIDPLRWQREVLFEDTNGFTIKSVGYCKSDKTLRFLAPLVAVDGLMLLYALYLCFNTRKVPSDFQEVSGVNGVFRCLSIAVKPYTDVLLRLLIRFRALGYRRRFFRTSRFSSSPSRSWSSSTTIRTPFTSFARW